MLAESWPPERSAAAAAFIDSIDMFTASMDETAEAAIANSTAMSGMLSALSEAKSAIDGMHEQWQTYARDAEFNARLVARSSYVNVPSD